MRILGLDISSVSTGYSIISSGRLMKSACGIIKTNVKKSHAERLRQFSLQLEEILDKYKPDEIICEDVFKGRNIKTFKVLCMFRGAALETIYRKTEKIPMSLSASETRSFLKITNTKEDAFNFIVKKYKLDFNFEEHNDISDSIALALAAHNMKKQGIDERSLRNSKRKKRNKRSKKKEKRSN